MKLVHFRNLIESTKYFFLKTRIRQKLVQCGFNFILITNKKCLLKLLIILVFYRFAKPLIYA